MMYKNNRKSLIDEYTDKFSDEDVNLREDYRGQRSLKKHLIRGLVTDIVDRVTEDPGRFSFERPTTTIEIIEKIKSILENGAPVTDAFKLEEIGRMIK